MNEKIINVTAGTSKRLRIAGNYSEGDIIVNAVYDKTKPVDYDDVISGKLLYNAKFNSDYYVDIDDSSRVFDTGGILYDKSGNEIEPYLNRFRKSISENQTIGTNDDLIVYADDTTGIDHRYVGYFPSYTLEDRIYTCKFTYARNFEKRHKVYFAMGTFYDLDNNKLMEGCGCDPDMPSLGIQLSKGTVTGEDGKKKNVISYSLARQSTLIDQGANKGENIFNSGTIPFEMINGQFAVTLKIVYNGGYVTQAPIKLFERTGKTASNNRYWEGKVIPVSFRIYLVVGSGDILNEYKICQGGFYQPATIPLLIGVGNYDNLTEGQFYGLKDFEIYRGDISIDRTILEDLTEYSGTYGVSPSLESDIILNTDNKYLTENLAIRKIAQNEWPNSQNNGNGIAIKIG